MQGSEAISLKKSFSESKLSYILVLIGFAVLTLIGAYNHEIWFDEAQAYVIARDNDITGITKQLGYEGHPILWYLILYVFSHLGFSCNILPFISVFFSFVAVSIIMFCSPFDLWVKCAVIFSGGFLYFNTVISRNYSLIGFFLAIIAAIYPKRKAHPIIYGLSVMGLANTHLCVCGFVGIIGIYMIYDLIKDFKKNTKKQNISEISGLIIAGLGVLCLVLPLLESLQKNNIALENTYSVKSVIKGFLSSAHYISWSFLFNEQSLNTIGYILVTLVSAVIILFIVLQRHKARSFFIILVSSIFFVIVSVVIWYITPNRAHIYFLMLFTGMWISEYETENKKQTKNAFKTESKLIAKIMQIDINYKKNSIILLQAAFILSIPTGAYYLFSDYTKEFNPSENACKFITENLPEDSVIVTNDEFGTNLSAYLPDMKFYSLSSGNFYTYCTHKVYPEVADEEIYEDLKDYDNIYYVFAATYDCSETADKNALYSHFGGMDFPINILYLEITNYSFENSSEYKSKASESS